MQITCTASAVWNYRPACASYYTELNQKQYVKTHDDWETPN